MGIGPVFALYFAAYDSSERYLRKKKQIDSTVPLTLPQAMACGGVTGFVGSLVLGPAELIKIRQQTAHIRGADASSAAALKGIFAGGPLGIFKGTGATILRDVPASAAWFGTYEFVKRQIAKDPFKPTALEALLAGGAAGISNWLVCIPLDMVKTTMQASTTENISFVQATSRIYASSGVRGFYRGLAPILLRAFPANAACFAVKEYTMQWFNKLDGTDKRRASA